MAIKVSKAELLKQAGQRIAYWVAHNYRVGLFKNDWVPADNDTIEAVEPCTFGGYSGLRALLSWESPYWEDNGAVAEHAVINWASNGGDPGAIFGYYVVDGDGALAWAERHTDGEQSIGLDGQIYSVTVKYRLKSEF